MNDQKTIMICGVPGVGKTTIVHKFVQHHHNWLHIEAGKLLKQRIKKFSDFELSLRNQDKIIENQNLIIEEFKKVVGVSRNRNVLFDSHIVVLSSEGVIKIPANIIKEFKPDKIIYVWDEPKIISKNIMKDTSRIRVHGSLQQIKEFQSIGVSYAQELAQLLGIEVVFVKSNELEQVLERLVNI